MKPSRSILLSVGLSAVFVTALATPARADISEATATELVAAALASEGITLDEGALSDELVAAIDEADELGVLDPEIVDVTENIEQPAPSESPSASPSPNGPLEELIDENTQEQLDTWADLSDEIQAAFDVIRADFAACRETSDSTSACAKGLGLRFQIALTEVKLAAIEAQIAAVASLPEDEQAVGLAELEAQQAKIIEKLAIKQAKFAARTDLPNAAADAAQAEALLSNYRVSVSENATSGGQAPAVTPSGGTAPGKSESSNGNSGNSKVPAEPGAESSQAPSDKANNGQGSNNGGGKSTEKSNNGKGNNN